MKDLEQMDLEPWQHSFHLCKKPRLSPFGDGLLVHEVPDAKPPASLVVHLPGSPPAHPSPCTAVDTCYRGSMAYPFLVKCPHLPDEEVPSSLIIAVIPGLFLTLALEIICLLNLLLDHTKEKPEREHMWHSFFRCFRWSPTPMLSKSILTYSTGSFASLLLEIQPVWGKNETQGLHYVDILRV